MIFVDGACSRNGSPYAKGGVGIYFGPWSSFNRSCYFAGNQTNQREEIIAASYTLRFFLDYALPSMVRRPSRVIIASDSKYVIHSMTDWVTKWKYNGWVNSKNQTVTNMDDLKRLDQRIEEAASKGIRVQFWSIPREDNEDADRLARKVTLS